MDHKTDGPMHGWKDTSYSRQTAAPWEALTEQTEHKAKWKVEWMDGWKK